jgi:predicted nucleic acid-binding protein
LISFVLDASVAVKWAMPWAQEPLTDEAVRLLKRYRDGEIDFLVPDVFWAEIGNVLWRGARQKRWSRADADVVVAEILRRDFQTVPSRILLAEAMKIACDYDRNIYDCLYVALATSAETSLITADERLANTLASRFPVKWLGTF